MRDSNSDSGGTSEAHVSTPQPPPREGPWVSRKDVIAKRSRRAPSPSFEGPPPPDRLPLGSVFILLDANKSARVD